MTQVHDRYSKTFAAMLDETAVIKWRALTARNVAVVRSSVRNAAFSDRPLRLGRFGIANRGQALRPCWSSVPTKSVISVLGVSEKSSSGSRSSGNRNPPGNANPPVAVNETVAQKHGTTKVARAYLEYLYTDSAQALGAKHYFRPTGPRSLAKFGGNFPNVKQFTIKEISGSWAETQRKHFADGGVFDQVYAGAKR